MVAKRGPVRADTEALDALRPRRLGSRRNHDVTVPADRGVSAMRARMAPPELGSLPTFPPGWPTTIGTRGAHKPQHKPRLANAPRAADTRPGWHPFARALQICSPLLEGAATPSRSFRDTRSPTLLEALMQL